LPAQTLPAELRPHKQPLDLADAITYFSHRDAPSNSGIFNGQKQAAAGRGVITGKFGELFFEVLKAEIDLKPCRVFFE
jgi:hypothetical protein